DHVGAACRTICIPRLEARLTIEGDVRRCKMRTLLKCILIASLSGIAGIAAAADVKVGAGIICDTKDQVERYVAVFKGDPADALTAVNNEAKKDNACGVAAIAYVESEIGDTARNGHGDAFRVVKILVLGVVTDAGVQRITPFPQFTIVRVEE